MNGFQMAGVVTNDGALVEFINEGRIERRMPAEQALGLAIWLSQGHGGYMPADEKQGIVHGLVLAAKAALDGVDYAP